MATNPYGDIFSGGGGAIASLFGSDEAPKAVLNRFAAPTAKASGRLATNLLGDVDTLGKTALDDYLAQQPRMRALAGDQEAVLREQLAARRGADPTALLRDVGNVAYGFINPNVINPLAQFDVNQNILSRRARGLNPAAVDSTSERLRNARVASQRYYDVARDVNANLPNLYGQAFNQGEANMAAQAGILPQVAAAYEGVANRPFTGIANRVAAAGGAQNVGAQGIQNITGATQGFKQPRNWADRVGAASQDIGQMVGGIANLAGGAAGGGSL